MPRLMISALRFVPGRAYGSQIYFQGFLQALAEVAPRRNFEVALAGSPAGCKLVKQWVPDLSTVSHPLPTSHGWSHIVEQLYLRRMLRRWGADLVFFPFYVASVTGVPSLVMVHDLVFRYYQQHYPLHRAPYMWLTLQVVKRSVRLADRVITPTEAIAREVRALGIKSPDAVVPIHEAVLVRKPPTRSPGGLPEIPADCTLLLQTGAQLPHKSSKTGIEALQQLRRQAPAVAARALLCITGGNAAEQDLLRRQAQAQGVERQVHILGKVTDAQLDFLVRRATAVLFPTLYEGFGLGVVEAQHQGKAAICSDIEVLREVTGGHAEFFEPGDPAAMAKAVYRIVTDTQRRRQMENEGPRWASRWTWRDHVDSFLDVATELANERLTVIERSTSSA